MADAFFPKELIHDIPYITLTGNSDLHIEQHRGMISYQPDDIIFETGCGLMKITGEQLVVIRYTASEAWLHGQIDAVIMKESGR